MIKEGFGIERNPTLALEYYFKAADKGNTKAMNSIAHIYLRGAGKNGEIIPPDKEKSFQWYLKSAELGDIRGIQVVAEMFARGEGTEQNFDKMDKWIGKFKMPKDANVIFNITRHLAKYPEKQHELFQKCAEAGYIPAVIRIVESYFNGDKITGQDFAKALEMLQQTVKKVDDDIKILSDRENYYLVAASRIGDIYYCGDGVEQDYKTAFEWYLKAAKIGFHYAAIQVGRMYYHGKGVNQNHSEAFKWFSKAANTKEKFNIFISRYNTVARYYVAKMYENGEGVEKNLKEALKWYKKAAEDHRNIEALHKVADMYYLGNGTEQNYELAFMYYEKAAENYSYWDA